ncbi:MAG: AMP-binding protein, partial [Burkholderiaceae bacterium]
MNDTEYSAQTDRFVHERLPSIEQRPRMLFEAPELQFEPRLNVVHELLDKAPQKGFGERAMLRSDALTLTYAQAREQVDRMAQVLVEDFALVPGNRVLLRGGNSIGMALAWLAVVKAGLVAVATMPLLRAKELGDIIDKSQPTLALCDARLLDELQQAQAQHPVLRSVLAFQVAGVPAAPVSAPAVALEPLMADKSGVFDACPTAATDVAMLAFTSGTTGKPKAAVHTHRDVLAACEAWPRHVLRATPEDIVMGSPPLAFTFGLGGMLVFPMWAGASVYFPSIAYTPQTVA